MNPLNQELRAQAVAHGLCEQWQGEWRTDKSPAELLEMYKRGIDFCIRHDYPSNGYIRSRFPAALLHEHFIFVDEPVFLPGGHSGVMVFNGGCAGEVSLARFDAATLHVRHGSRLRVTASGASRVFVHAYDRADISVSCAPGARAFVYLHGQEVRLHTEGEVGIRQVSKSR